MARDSNSRQPWNRAKALKHIEYARNKGATELDLSSLSLTGLPDAIGNLTQLTELYVHSNRLTALPDAIGDLAQLTALLIGGNRLTALPDAIGDLTQLTELHVYGNQLTALPDSMKVLTSHSSVCTSTTTMVSACPKKC